MALSFENPVQATTYQKVETYLKQSHLFQNALRADPQLPKFDILYGSTLVEIEVLSWQDHPWQSADMAIVRATSCVTVGSSVNHDLMHFLLSENRRMRFGAFHLDEAGQVRFAESVLGGDNMDLRELQTCILAVVTIADTYDDLIAEKFGGYRAIDRINPEDFGPLGEAVSAVS
ncbi:MAG: YbjN domain-containing protein [Cyanobacteria bacterium]|nr:YbjN domain-containing protein [Cyanobacteriota bacterium]MEB3267547.1 YbjN domain-containing protein [Leptolyngbya sp.]